MSQGMLLVSPAELGFFCSHSSNEGQGLRQPLVIVFHQQLPSQCSGFLGHFWGGWLILTPRNSACEPRIRCQGSWALWGLNKQQASLVLFSQEQSNILQDKNPTHIMHTRCEWEAPLISHMKAREAAPLCLAGLSDQAMPLQLTALEKEILIPVSAPGSTLCYSLAQEEFLESPILGTVISLSRKRIVQESMSKTDGNRQWRQPNPASPKELC